MMGFRSSPQLANYLPDAQFLYGRYSTITMQNLRLLDDIRYRRATSATGLVRDLNKYSTPLTVRILALDCYQTGP